MPRRELLTHGARPASVNGDVTSATISAAMPLLTLYLLVFPGYCLLPRSCPRRLRLPFALFVSVIVTSVVGLLLLWAGRFDPWLVAALELPLAAWRLHRRPLPGLHLRLHVVPLVLAAALVAFVLLTLGEPFDATGDAGVYTIAAHHVAETGRWGWSLDEAVPDAVPTGLAVRRVPYALPWLEVAPGFVVEGDRVRPQFLPLYPLWGALQAPWAGRFGPLAANLAGALLLLVGLHAAASQLLPRPFPHAVAATVAVSPVLLVFLRYPTAETFLAGLLAGWLLWTMMLLRRPSAAGAVIPALLLALAVLTKFFAWAVVGLAGLLLLTLAWRRLLPVAAVHAAAVVPAVAAILLVSPAHLVNHIRQLAVVEGLPVVALGLGAAVLVRLGWRRWSRRLSSAAALLLGLVAAWMAVVRPEPVETGSENNLLELAALCGWGVVAAAAVGVVWWILLRRPVWRTAPVVVAVLVTLYLLLGSGDTTLYPFAARRYLPLTVPLMALFLVFPVARLRGWSRRVVAIAVVAFVVQPLGTQAEALLLPRGDGFLNVLEQIRAAVRRFPVAVAVGESWRYVPHLQLDGEPVAGVEPRPWPRLVELRRWLASRPEAVVLTDEARVGGVLAVVEERRPTLAPRRAPPLEVGAVRARFTLFRPARSELRFGRRVDVGFDDQLAIVDAWRPEAARERSFRWTRHRTWVLLARGDELRLTWSAGGHPGAPVPVEVFIDRGPVAAPPVPKAWTTTPWIAVPAGERGFIVVEVRSPTFQPARSGPGHDLRELGVKLDRVEVR